MEWLGKAADHGNQFARYRLGKIYLVGESVPKDVEKALAYLTASADQEINLHSTPWASCISWGGMSLRIVSRPENG